MHGHSIRSIGMNVVLLCLMLGVVSAHGDDEFFPSGLLDDPLTKKTAIAAQMATGLREMGEPSLWRRSRVSRTGDVFRVFWWPSEGERISVRVEEISEELHLTTVIFDDLAITAADRKIVRRTRLSLEDWSNIQRHVERTNFWNMESKEKHHGLDGEDLLVEGVKRGQYHAVLRWNPESGPYRRLCRLLINLAHIDVDDTWYETRHVVPRIGDFVIVVTEQSAVALRFLRHTNTGAGGAIFEWYLQNDGSCDFTRPNVEKGSDEVFERDYMDISMKAEMLGHVTDIHCGEIELRWSKGDAKCDVVYLPNSILKRAKMAIFREPTLKTVSVNMTGVEWVGATTVRSTGHDDRTTK